MNFGRPFVPESNEEKFPFRRVESVESVFNSIYRRAMLESILHKRRQKKICVTSKIQMN